MTDAKGVIAELELAGLEPREARWLYEEFSASGTLDRGALERASGRRLGGEPLQYVIGHWPFRNLDLIVDKRALIPRPESEELVGVALGELAHQGRSRPLVVDLGCGGGAIGLAILDELRSRGVVGTLISLDESEEALTLARENAALHQLDNVSFVRSSWYSGLDATYRGSFDLIVANPPYVSAREFKTLDPVLHYEPLGAIVSDDDADNEGFADLNIIISDARTWLGPGGVLVCEHANTHRAAALSAATLAGFRDAVDHDDVAGLPRILVART